jgi:AcrR family transcriptional regulator
VAAKAVMSCAVITVACYVSNRHHYTDPVARWEPDSHGRLTRAAIELFAERGFEQTTALDVAQRARVTERTFYRYFTDKREVLFEGASQLQEAVVAHVASAPLSMTPIDAAGAAMQAAAAFLGSRRDYARERAAVITANPSLQERELLKLATLAAAVARALRDRGVPDRAAALAAETGVTVFKVGFDRWVGEDSAPDLAQCIREALDELRQLAAPA